MQVYQNYIAGRWQVPTSNRYLDVINPTTEAVIGQVAASQAADVDLAVQAAKAAFPAWSNLAVQERAAYVKKIGQIIEERQEELCLSIVSELGSAYRFSQRAQVQQSLKEIRQLLADLPNFAFEERMGQTLVLKEAAGVVACITPWNYPLNQIQRKLIPAILAGNTVVVKPASDTPLTAFLFAEIIDQAGLPAGVVNMLSGSGREVGDRLAQHPDVAIISFTGSTQVGKHLYQAAQTNVKHLILELGGKSALIYLEGGDLDQAIRQAAMSTLNNSGQTCAALTRLLVPAKRLEETKAKIRAFYQKNARVGDPMASETVLGPMVSQRQKETVLQYIEWGKEEGAEVLIGGQGIVRQGYYVEPTVFVNVHNQMRIAQEEIFGPVLVVLTYDTVEEAIKIANDSPYGLSGAVVGPEEAALAVARQLRTGNVYVNEGERNLSAPFGGYKESGIGREIGLYGLADYLELKSIFC